MVSRVEKLEVLLAELLRCGTADLDVLLDIDEDILLEAIERLRNSGMEINFQTLYVESVKVACEREKINFDEISVDANYLVSRVYARNKRWSKKLEKYGFAVLGY